VDYGGVDESGGGALEKSACSPFLLTASIEADVESHHQRDETAVLEAYIPSLRTNLHLLA
jgi:hypothetical protein